MTEQDRNAASGRQAPLVRRLADVPAGEEVVVAGYQKGVLRQTRLIAMGLVVGRKIVVLQNHGGMVMVSCNGSRVALGQRMSRKILVTPTPAVVPPQEKNS